MKLSNALLFLSLAITHSVFGSQVISTPSGKMDVRWTGIIDEDIVQFSRDYLNTAKAEHYTEIKRRHEIQVDAKSVRRRVRAIWYFPRHSDIESNGNQLIYFNAANEKLTIHSAASVSPNGSIKSFKPETIQFSDSNQYNTFSDVNVAILAIPGIEAGGIAFLDYEIETDKSALEAEWSDILYPKTVFEIQDYGVKVSHTPDIDIEYHYNGDELICTEYLNGFSCTAEHIPAVKQDKSVYWMDLLPQLVITEGEQSWQKISHIMLEKFNRARGNDAGIDQIFEELVEGKATLEDKISAIHAFVSRGIRYNSMSETGHAITPHNISETVNNRYGDCKDKSALLLELLNKLELNPVPVLIATERKNLEAIPAASLDYFNHVVVCNQDKKMPFCIDATDTDTDWRSISNWIQGSVALPLVDDAKPVRLPQHKYRWRLKSQTELSFDDKGGQTELNKREFLGEYAGTMRSMLSAQKPDDQLRWAIQSYKRVTGVDEVPEFRFSGVESIAPRLTIESSTYFSPFLSASEDLPYSEPDLWLRDELDSVEIPNKHYGYHFPGLHVESRYHIDLGTLWQFEFPGATLDLKHKFGSLTRELIHVDTKELTLKSSLEIPSRYVTPDEIEIFNKFLAKLRKEARLNFLAKKID